ncbi:hypothetical protein SAMN02927924_04473 [Sphingobium faniae]|nr:hypothetical protein SAMN02927924_04473 [Sphingobium faniae]
MDIPDYDPVAQELAGRLSDVIRLWRDETGACFSEVERNLRLAEAMHLLTWRFALSHAPLALLFDEENAGTFRNWKLG